MTETDAQTANDQIADLRKKQEEANKNGDSRRANEYYQQEMALIEKRDGRSQLVGVDGRTF